MIVQKEGQIDLTVCGFVRENYRHSVPVAILNLMESFYSLWIKRQLSCDQLQRLKDMIKTKKDSIPLHSFMIKGVRMELILEGLGPLLLGFGDDQIWLSLKILYPSEIKYISGYFVLDFDQRGTCPLSWWRIPRYPAQSYLVDSQYFLLSEFQNRDELLITAYCDITQIKWNEDRKQDFDRTPILNSRGQHHWCLNEQELCHLRSEETVSKVPGNEWNLSLMNVLMQNDDIDRVKGLNIRVGHSFFPLDVGCMKCIWIIHYDINGRSYWKDKEVFNPHERQKCAWVSLDVDLEDVKDAHNEVNIEFDIQYEITQLYDWDTNEIDRADWKKYNVI